MVAYTAIGFLLLLGTMCAGLAVLLHVTSIPRPGQTEADDAPPRTPDTAADGADVPPDAFAHFHTLVNDRAPQILQHLVDARRSLGPCGVRTLGQSYIEESGKPVRSDVLRALLAIYAADDPDEDTLDQFLDEIKQVRQGACGAGAGELLDEIARTSPVQVYAWTALADLFTVTETRITKVKGRFIDIDPADVPAPGTGVDGQLATLVTGLHELLRAIGRHLPPKGTRNKAVRKDHLERCVAAIERWMGSCAAFTDPGLTVLPEGILAQKLVAKVWQKINALLDKSGGRARPWPDVSPTPVQAEATPAPTVAPTRKPIVAMVVLAVAFYAGAGAVWVGLFTTRIDVDRVLGQIVLIETPDGKGTGFFVRDTRLIVTNHHVVKPFDAVTVTVKARNQPDGPHRKYRARVLIQSEARDTAVLELQGPYADASLPRGLDMARDVAFHTGQAVHVFGHPVGLTDIYTRGSVIKVQDDLGLMDVKIGPGNSGGPVCDGKGVVIGITTAYVRPKDDASFEFGIALPTTYAWALIDRLPARPPR